MYRDCMSINRRKVSEFRSVHDDRERYTPQKFMQRKSIRNNGSMSSTLNI